MYDPTSYLSHKDRIEGALRYLETHGLPVGPLWTAHSDRLAAFDSETPSDFDKRYELPVDRPTIPEHFQSGRPQILSAGHIWPGYSYSLSPGQRAWLKENYGLTPTMTVTVYEAAVWPGTRHPRVIKLRSDIHVDPRARKHVLIDAVIRQPGKFFQESAARDAELEAAKVRAEAEAEARGEKKSRAPKTRVLPSITDYLAELEAELK